jgi:CRP-like cAMP-binding protein
MSGAALGDSDQGPLMAVFENSPGSVQLRVAPVLLPRGNAHGNANIAQVAKSVPKPAPAANSLLAALPPKELRQLNGDMERVALSYGEILYEPGEQIKHVYFPNDSLVSLLTVVDRHQALEVGLVGREGVVGVPLALEIRISPVRALVQGSGTAMRIKAAPFLKAFRQSPALQRELHHYTYSLMAQITQTAACNRFHVVEARLARWLLMTHDRMQCSPFQLTQDFLAQMLGVRRVGVTKAARALQQSRLISYSRGNITILDRKGLEAACCSCYEIVKDMHEAAGPRRVEAAGAGHG